jgi:hypothetical protein
MAPVHLSLHEHAVGDSDPQNLFRMLSDVVSLSERIVIITGAGISRSSGIPVSPPDSRPQQLCADVLCARCNSGFQLPWWSI